MGGLLAMGLLAGCGGVADAEEQPFATREDELPYCDGAYTVIYYSDASYTTAVGHADCSCGNTLRVFGQKTEYALYSLISCDPDPEG
ncbi:Hypothetical protein AA314_08823 [Archangium gephyra]|nr:Hypothetical protein AA314_08823 [Archangium gephyra]